MIGIDHNYATVRAAQGVGRHDYRTGNEIDMQRTIEERPWDAVLLDPPRTGAIAIMQSLAESNAGRIVYVSCDPATLARDAKVLAKSGWQLARAVVVDMFPHTAHIESVNTFVRS